MRLCGISAALRETRVLVSSSEMSARSSITFTSIRTKRLFAHIGSNTRLLTASPASEATKTQRTMADLLGLSSNKCTAGGSETSHGSSDFAALPAMHDTHDTHDTHDKHDTHDTQDTHDVSFTDTIDKAESIRFSSRFKTSTTVGFQPTEHRTTEYISNQMKIIDDGPGVFPDQAINCIRATEDVQFEIIDANLSKSLEQAEKFAKICDLNFSLAAKVKDLKATEPVRDVRSREFAAGQREIGELEEELWIENR